MQSSNLAPRMTKLPSKRDHADVAGSSRVEITSGNACIEAEELFRVQAARDRYSPRADIRIAPAGLPHRDLAGETGRGKGPLLVLLRHPPRAHRTSKALRMAAALRYLPECHYLATGSMNATAFRSPTVQRQTNRPRCALREG